MKWVVPEIWKGSNVWIIGGGPSITEELSIPKDIVAAVLSGTLPISSYEPYFHSLYTKHVIGINIAFMIADWFDMIYFGDDKFFTKYQFELYQYPNLCVSNATNTKDVPWVKYLAKHPKGTGISPLKTTVCWNQNSGAAAISVAASAGAKRIFLMGFDMDNLSGVSHWHGKYKRAVLKDGTMKPPPYARHKSGFSAIAHDAKKMGIQIINVSPKSTIKEFPKMTFKEAIAL